MGTNVEYSVCSACGTSARFAKDYCDHLRHRKGAMIVTTANSIRDLLDKDLLRPEWLKHVVTSSFDVKEILNGISNKPVSARAGEINHKLSFFELSIVGMPAYAEAEVLEKIARQQDEGHKDYIRRIAKTLGRDAIVDLYEILQEEGLISSMCKVA